MKVELLSPAGNLEKLKTAFAYGADAAYMGLEHYSLRANAGNFSASDVEAVRSLKSQTGKKLYCTMNILFQQHQMETVRSQMDEIRQWPFDAFIISDIGLVPLLRREFPEADLHLSTQASCLNSESAKMYHQMGFSRIILGREASLDDIKRIKDAVPELELECFVHGAMCMAYSGRCLLSAFLTGRSGNQGDCSHTCRWNYRLKAEIEEQERPGTYFPIEESPDGFTTILSSKDLCMIDHVDDLVSAGLSSLKIEGRMKSVYYDAVVTRAYRKALDHDPEWKTYREDLFNVSHREFSTGFFFGHDDATVNDIDRPTSYGYQRNYLFLGTVEEEVRPNTYKIDVRGQIKKGKKIEYIAPDFPFIEDDDFSLIDEDGHALFQLDHGKKGYLVTDKPLHKGYIIRTDSPIKTIQ